MINTQRHHHIQKHRHIQRHHHIHLIKINLKMITEAIHLMKLNKKMKKKILKVKEQGMIMMK